MNANTLNAVDDYAELTRLREENKQMRYVFEVAVALRQSHAKLMAHMGQRGVADEWDELMREREHLCNNLWQAVDHTLNRVQEVNP